MYKPSGYSILGYGQMIRDRARMDPYAQALRKAVLPGSVVMDIGAGTGIFSLLACQLGASEVHAIEPNAAIELAQSMALANGCADRLHCHRMLSTDFTPARRADVIISDLRGSVPLFQHHISTIIDARHRLLAPQGVMIPSCDRLWVAPIEAPDIYKPYAEPWRRNNYGLDMSSALQLAVNTLTRVSAKPEQLVCPGKLWTTLDYHSIEQLNASGELAWQVESDRIVHGLLIWFDTELVQGVGFSNAPEQPKLVYGQLFLPLQQPVGLAAGDMIAVSLHADLVDANYLWRWNTRITTPGEPPHSKASFQQSTFFSAPLSLEQIKKQEPSHIPQRAQAIAIDEFVLSRIDGDTPLGDIAAALLNRFPERFHQQAEALKYSYGLLQRYGSA